MRSFDFFFALLVIFSRLSVRVLSKPHKNLRNYESTPLKRFRFIALESREERRISFPVKNLGLDDPFFSNVTTYSLGSLSSDAFSMEVASYKTNESVVDNFCKVSPMQPEITVLQENSTSPYSLKNLKVLLTKDEIYLFSPETSKLDIFTVSEREASPVSFESSLSIKAPRSDNWALLRNPNTSHVYLVSESKVVVVGLVSLPHNQSSEEEDIGAVGEDNVEYYDSEGQNMNRGQDNNSALINAYGIINQFDVSASTSFSDECLQETLEQAYFFGDCFYLKLVFETWTGKVAMLQVYCLGQNQSALNFKEGKILNLNTKILVRNGQLIFGHSDKIEVVNVFSINSTNWEKDAPSLLYFEKVNKTLLLAMRENSEYGPIVALHEFHLNNTDSPQGPPQHVRRYKFPFYVESKDFKTTQDFLIVNQIDIIKVFRYSIPSRFKEDNFLISSQMTENLQRIEASLDANIILLLYHDRITVGLLKTPAINLDCFTNDVSLGHYFIELNVLTKKCPNAESSFCSYKTGTLIQVDKEFDRESVLYMKNMFVNFVITIAVVVVLAVLVSLTFMVKYQRMHKEYKRLKSMFDSEMVGGSHID